MADNASMRQAKRSRDILGPPTLKHAIGRQASGVMEGIADGGSTGTISEFHGLEGFTASKRGWVGILFRGSSDEKSNVCTTWTSASLWLWLADEGLS